MSFWQAILLGIIQGVTEFLPVSSSGHLVLAQHWLGFEEPQLLFDVAVHFSTLFAVAIFFFPVLLRLRFKQWFLIGVGTIPAVIIGLFFKDMIEALFAAEMIVSGALLVTAGMNFFADKQLEKVANPDVAEAAVEDKISELTWWQALIVGIFQAFAIIPGISRSGSTLAGGLTQKLDRQTAFTFSFLLSLPAIAGATLLQVLDVVETGSLSLPVPVLVIGGLAAFSSGYASLWIFKKIVTNARLEVFGWYCLLLGLGSLILPAIL
jgi:undecaprenyl-diphosphatase